MKFATFLLFLVIFTVILKSLTIENWCINYLQDFLLLGLDYDDGKIG